MTTEILIYGEIGLDVTAQYVAEMIAEADGDDLHVRFNTPGGVGTEGLTIYNRLAEYDGRVKGSIDGVCASAGMIAACGCDELVMASNAWVLVHDAWVRIEGNARDLESRSAKLKRFDEQQAQIYADRTGLPLNQVHKLMDREDELDAQEALSLGLIDAITGESRIAATMDKDKIMARAKTTKKTAAKKKAAPKRRPTKKAAQKKSRRVRTKEEEFLEEDDDEFAEEDDEFAEDDEEMSEDDEFAEDDEEMSEDDEEMAEDDDEESAEEEDDRRPRAASYGKIVKCCHGLDPEDADDALFVTRQLKSRASVSQVQANWMKELKARASEAPRRKSKRGVKPLARRRGSRKRQRFGDPRSEFKSLVNAKVQSGMDRFKAVKAVNRENPELREAVIEAANSN